MEHQYSRLEMLLGREALEHLRKCRVAVFGVGGVGGYVVEALARSGIGTLDIIDNDRVAFSNLNRQIISLHSTLGQKKVDVAEARIHDIDPDTKVIKHELFYLPETADEIDLGQFDYVVDAIDTVAGKLEIITRARDAGVPVLSVMGCGNRLDPTKLVVTDIYKSSNDPLARVMRRELKKRGIRKLKIVYSTELPLKPREVEGPDDPDGPDEQLPDAAPINVRRRGTPGSTAFVPSCAGLVAASVVVRDLLETACCL